MLADTGAKICVFGERQARIWNILDRMVKTSARIKPYKSDLIPVIGKAKCAVTYDKRTVPVDWYIIKEECEPVLSGIVSKELGIIKFCPKPAVFQPIYMIKAEEKEELQSILKQYPNVFQGIGKLKQHQVKLHVDSTVVPIACPARSVLYHLRDRVDEAIDEMIAQDIIEEHPTNEAAPWVSNIVVAPKPNGEIRITLDAKNVNKAIQASNMPIPVQEDIRAKLAKVNIFSKLDLKSAFWQLELAPESRYLTVFHANHKLLRYKRLSMGLKPAQGALNAAVVPLISRITGAHIIHDDLVSATCTWAQHYTVLKQVLEVMSERGLTLNPKKCVFGENKLNFLGMIIDEGVGPDPAKVEALEHLQPPQNKWELISFLCMLQSNSSFIPNFSRKAAVLRELTHSNARFKWGPEQQLCYEELLQSFKKDALLKHFNPDKQTFMFTDAHITGLGAMLAQGNTITDARPIAVASRTTTKAEKRYAQIDLEGLGVDYALRRFRKYIVGSPTDVIIGTGTNRGRRPEQYTLYVKCNTHNGMYFPDSHCWRNKK